jgi:putative FmdB family regulatory protein
VQSKKQQAKTMPIYDFQCTSCAHKDELMRKISESSILVCPKCSKETFSKMLSAPSFQLSGTGWYASDFKDKKSNKTQTETDKSETKSAEVVTKPAVSTVPVVE